MRSHASFPRFAAFFLIAFCLTISSAFGQVKDWNDFGGGNWETPGNWFQNAQPNAIDLVRIGNLPTAHGSTVFLNANTTIRELQLTNDATLAAIFGSLFVSQDTSVSGNLAGGQPTRLFVSNLQSFTTRDLTLADSSRVELDDGFLNVNRIMEVQQGTSVWGSGMINLNRNGGTALYNDGTLRSFQNGLQINQNGTGLIDLDGQLGSGQVVVGQTGTSDVLTIDGTQLADSFSGNIQILGGSNLQMNLSDGWTADAQSQINMFGNAGSVVPGRISGNDFTLAGELNALTSFFGSGPQRIEANTTIQESASINIDDNNRIEFTNATINGGNFLIGEDAELEFSGPTRIEGGTFNTFSNLSSDGWVRFSGLLTEWAGTVNINGNAQQFGDADISSNTVINADVIDMDGLGGSIWNIDSSLTINADNIDSSISNTFDGLINVGPILGSELSVNLHDPAAHWTIAGTLVIENDSAFDRTVVSGNSRIRMTGNLAVFQTGNQITADFDLAASSHTIGQGGINSLVFQGQTLVESGAQFTNLTSMINGTDGHLTLADGASLDETNLVNHGLLEIGEAPGIADVANFESGEDATWRVQIGGYLVASEYDVLLVSDSNALLDGTLEVDLIDLGGGLFAPEVGDEFTILSSLGGVSGEFDNTPISISDGTEYLWEVIYNPHDVTLRVAGIGVVPEPGAAIICSIFSLGLVLRRRSRTTI